MAVDALGALVACSRFGLGARPGDLAAAAGDPRGFALADLDRPDGARLPDDLPNSASALAALFADQERVRLERERVAATVTPNAAAPAQVMAASAAPTQPTVGPATPHPDGVLPAPAPATAAMQPEGKPKPPEPPLDQRLFRAEVMARLRHQVTTDVGLVERLVAFWSNHFAVSVSKGQFVRVASGPFEREAIRPHVLGRFADMLRAVEQHPAMINFLDNEQSIGPSSPAGRNRTKGLNENLGREILELHTLGVGGGYTQADVTSLARVITGWTTAGRDGKLGTPGTFVFRAQTHEPGPQTVLGRLYDQTDRTQGEAVLDDLARHPATARHLATKLVRHFIADVPPPALVARLERVYLDSDGDLKAVTTALVGDDTAWQAPLTKLRTPAEFLVAMLRATGTVPPDPGAMLQSLNALGEPLWQPSGPNGFPDTVDAWASPEAMKLRLDVAWAAAGRVRDIGNPVSVLDSTVGLAVSPETRQAVARAETRQQALAILFMSPEFQRR